MSDYKKQFDEIQETINNKKVERRNFRNGKKIF